MTETVKLEYVEAEARLTLCQPASRNALTVEDIRLATELIGKAGRQPGIRVLRICAQGEVFCAGRAHETPKSPSSPTSEDLRARLIEPILALYRALHGLDIVSVAQVQGDAHGLGCALVSACDIAVAASGARFSLPEMEKDLPPTLAISAFGRKVHPKVTASMVLGLATLDAASAQRAGIVGEVVPADALAGRVDEIVGTLSRRHPLAIATVKRYLRGALAPDYEVCSEMAAALLSGSMPAIRATSG